jgi:hypothetical protein
MRIGNRSKGEVSKGEIDTSLTNAGSIEMTLFDVNLCPRKALAYLCQLYAADFGKPIAIVEYILQRSHLFPTIFIRST